MKIYSPHPKAYGKPNRAAKTLYGTQTLYFTPGRENPETPAFMVNNEKGDPVPKQFKVEFVNGEAEVDENLGQWLLDHGHALKSKKEKRLVRLLTDQDEDD